MSAKAKKRKVLSPEKIDQFVNALRGTLPLCTESDVISVSMAFCAAALSLKGDTAVQLKAMKLLYKVKDLMMEGA